MTDFIDEFVEAMAASGCAPARVADIKPGQKSVLIRAADDGKTSKSLYYTLSIEGDRASGRWFSCKSGKSESWSSKSNKKWTKEEKEAWAKKRREEQKAHDAEVKKKQKEIADQAKKLWARARVNEDHPYLKKKQIPTSNTRCVDEMLLIPMKDENAEIWNLQTILPDGSKFNSFVTGKDDKGKNIWATGGRKQGLYHSIAKRKPDLSKIAICEGFATGGSIAMASGSPAIVAFDTGNLKDVALKIKKKYPESDIIIAADNDQWTIKSPRPEELKDIKAKDIPGDNECWATWRNKGYLFNPGLEKGREAADAIEARFVYPAPPENSKEKPTDFNDMHVIMGVEAVWTAMSALKEVAISEPPPSYLDEIPEHVLEEALNEHDIIEVFNPKPRDNSPKAATPEEDEYSGVDELGFPKWNQLLKWKTKPTAEKEGQLDPSSGRNTQVLIERQYPGMFRHNEFSDEIWICVRPPWEAKKKFIVRPFTDNDVVNMAAELETLGLNYNPKRTREAIETVAEKHSIHPVRTWFDQLKWDGVPRLGTWLERYCGAMEQDKDYLKTVGTIWMVAAVRRIYEPGVKFDHMLVLEGKQAIGKSTALRILSTFGDDYEVSYFTEMSMSQIGKSDALQISQGKLIIEFAELDGIKSAADTKLKSWISAQVDEIVKKYKTQVTKYPRQFILAGTTNDDDYLKDSTGNRRYWPVRCHWINTRELKKVQEQLWAEAIYLHKQKHKIYISDDDPVYKLTYEEQAKRLDTDPWEERVINKIELKRFISSAEVLSELGLPVHAITPKEQGRVNSIMKKLKWEQRQDKKITGHRRRVWFNPKYDNVNMPVYEKPEEEVEIEY
jgi:predicted P-loop ATPase/phage/plasmid primase-like uncharacterized protein